MFIFFLTIGFDEAALQKLIDASSSKVAEVAEKIASKGISTNAVVPKSGPTKRKAVEMKSNCGVVVVSRIPYGFFEEQMRGFFSQFGTITRLRISRNRKTGKSRHFGFIEFESREVAAIVADTMNNYMMFGRTLECKYLPPSQVHPDTFRNADRKFKVVPWTRINRDRHNATKTEQQIKTINDRLVKREDKLRKKLSDLGYDYDFSGYANKQITPPAKEVKVSAKKVKSSTKAAAPVSAPTPVKSNPTKEVKSASSKDSKPAAKKLKK